MGTAIEASSGQRPLGARLLYLGQRTLGVRVTPNNLDHVIGELETTWSSLTADCESGEFAPTTGPLCAWCPFLSACADGQAEVRARHDAGNVRADAPGLAVIYYYNLFRHVREIEDWKGYRDGKPGEPIALLNYRMILSQH